MGERGGGTRARIQDVALELFTEYGYDKTSLREIADRLGVTKAALYYHFKSKDDIVTSLLDDFVSGIDAVVTWADGETPTPETRRELIRRYSEVMREQGARFMRFMAENQPAMREHKGGEEMKRRMSVLATFISDPADPLPVQIRSRMALFTLHAARMAMRDAPDLSNDELHDAALEAALSMLPADGR